MKTVPFRFVFTEANRRVWAQYTNSPFGKFVGISSVVMFILGNLVFLTVVEPIKAYIVEAVLFAMFLPLFYWVLVEDIINEQRTQLPNEDDY